MKIITDTNVWYHISEGKYKNILKDNLPLCLTSWNILELLTSPKLKMSNEKKKVIEAAKTIVDLNPMIISEEPFSFIASNILGIPNQRVHKLRIKDLEKLINDEISNDELIKYIEFRNERVIQFRDSVKKQQANNLTNFQSTTTLDMGGLIEAVGQQTIAEVESILKLSRADINQQHLILNGSQINFFLRVRAIYNFKLDNEVGYKVEKNDQGDILNMVYVGQKDKYWTGDCKWIKNIIDSGLSDFIYSPIADSIVGNK